MNQNNIFVSCAKCGTKNRIPQNRVKDSPICGKCKQPLDVGNFPSTPVDISDQSFDEEVFTFSGPVLVDCWAEWCVPCKMIDPIVKEIASEKSGILKVGKLNVDESQNTAQKLGITSIPTILIYKEGQLVDSIIGAAPKNLIVDKVESYI